MGTCFTATATEFYIHDNNDYWWYHSEDPHFYAVVPSNGQRYSHKSLFGYEMLEIAWDDSAIIMEVGTMSGLDQASIIDFVGRRWTSLLANPRVFADREITTSNDLKTYFYGVEGTGPNNVKSMLRSVYFYNADKDTTVYLAYFIPNSKYTGQMEQYWLRAVNEFEW